MFKYKTEALTHGRFGHHKGEINRVMLEARLEELGKEGWDLCWLELHANLHKEKDAHLLIFKKEISLE